MYRDIISSLDCHDEIYDSEVDQEKIKILIDSNAIEMNPQQLSFIRENYPELTIDYITSNIEDYISNTITDEIFILNEMLSLLDLNDIEDDIKTQLLEFTDSHISIIDKSYSVEIKDYILSNNLEANDIPMLLRSYSSHPNKLKLTIERIAIEYIEMIIEQKYEMSIDLFNKLLASDNISGDVKIQLFIIMLPTFSATKCKEYLEMLKLGDYINLFTLDARHFKLMKQIRKSLIYLKKRDGLEIMRLIKMIQHTIVLTEEKF